MSGSTEFDAEVSLTVRAATGDPATVARSVSAAVTGVNQNLTLGFRPLSDMVNASITQERLVAMLSAFFWRARAAARWARALRHHGVRGEPATDRARHPAGGRRFARQRGSTGARARRAAHRRRDHHWRDRKLVGVELRRGDAVRAGPAGPGDDGRSDRRARCDRRARGIGTREAGGGDRSGTGVTRRIAPLGDREPPGTISSSLDPLFLRTNQLRRTESPSDDRNLAPLVTHHSEASAADLARRGLVCPK